MAVFTIGHSSHSAEVFLGLLRRHRVTAVADVRSAPYSRFNPQFNKETLARSLEAAGTAYVFLGRELGGRSDDPGCFEDGRIQYQRVAKTERFRQGLDRVVEGAGRYRIALMCAEREPLECHRTLLVARALDERGVEVRHLLADGGVEPHGATIERLLELHGMGSGELFRGREERVAEAFARQAERFAFVDERMAGEGRR